MGKLELRPANHSDIEYLYELRNDELVIANSISNERPNKLDHAAWFEKKLNDQFCFFYIGVMENTKVGFVRFDVDSQEQNAIISIALSDNFRGRGLAKRILADAISKFRLTKTCVLIAKVKASNIASKKCFEDCGFVIYGVQDNVVLLKNKDIVIDAIQKVRSRNNVNWMDLMRLAFRTAPSEAEKIFLSIGSDDNEISSLLRKLTH